jgi:hypothetical protein
MQVLRKFVVAVGATLAFGLLPAAAADAADRAAGKLFYLDEEFKEEKLRFDFYPKDEKVSLHDSDTNGYGALVELWWGGRLQRWCYNTRGGGRDQDCDFEIPEGQQIRFYVAEITRKWLDCKREGCGKRTHFWAGPFGQNGCESNGYNDPCAFGEGDFVGQA